MTFGLEVCKMKKKEKIFYLKTMLYTYIAGVQGLTEENERLKEELTNRKSSCNLRNKRQKITSPAIDTSKINVTEAGNIIRHETLIKPWQQNVLDILEKNECLEKENKQLREKLKKINDFIQAGDLCSICKFENKCNPNNCYNQNTRVYTKFEVKK